MSVDMFLKLNGIDGESADDKHAKEIDVLAWSWGMSQSGNTHLGTGSGAGKVSVQDLSVTHYVDAASTALATACCKGTHIPDGLLTVRKAGDTPLEYIKLTIKDIIVTSLSTGGSGGEDRLTENFTLNFAEYKLEYTAQTKTGGAGKTGTATYNMQKNKA